jgi:hypothetical protein
MLSRTTYTANGMAMGINEDGVVLSAVLLPGSSMKSKKAP